MLFRARTIYGFRLFSSSTKQTSTNNKAPFWIAGATGLGIAAGAAWFYQKRKNDYSSPVLPVRDGAFVLDSLANTSAIKEESIKRLQNQPNKEAKKLKTKYLLIGGGLASFAALEIIVAHEKDADVLMLTEESCQPYMRPPLSKELWYNFEKDPANDEILAFADWHGDRRPIFFESMDYFNTDIEDELNRKPKLMIGKKVTRIDSRKKTATLHDGTVVEFEKALIATGSRPKTLDYCTEPEVTNISYLRKLSDFKKLRKAVDTIDSLVIIGGGFVGSELTASIASYCSIERPDRPVKIIQIFPEEGNMGLVFPKYLSNWVMKQLKGLGVDIWPNSKIKSISKLSGDKARIVTETGGNEQRIAEADHILVAIGSEPNISLNFDPNNDMIELDESETGGGAIKVSPALEIIPEIVFGAGDVISYFDSSLGLTRSVHHYDHALNSGRLAGYNMVRKDPEEFAPYKTISLFWSDLGPTIGYEAVGLVDSSLTTVGVWAKGSPKDTPQNTELESKDIRRELVGQTSPTSSTHGQSTNNVENSGSAEFRKGLVLYVKDRVVVGFLMFNLFNRTSLAKNILKQRMPIDDLQGIVELFNINDS